MDARRRRKVGGWVTMLVLLAMGVVPFYLNAMLPQAANQGQTKVESTHVQLFRLEFVLESYRFMAGHYPTAEQGLEVLVYEPIEEPVPKKWQQFFKEVPRDAWDREFVYRFPGSREAGRPEIISKGKDGVLGTADDLFSQDEAGTPPVSD